MSSYVDTPISTDNLNVSAPQIRGNFTQANTSFGMNHYAFNDQTANNGKHSVIQTPLQGSVPSTVSSEPAIYAYQDSANIGVINYSRGPSDAVPSPITVLQSPVTPITLTGISNTTVMNFSGLARAMCSLYAFANGLGSLNTAMYANVYWDGTTVAIINNTAAFPALSIKSSGSQLIISNSDGEDIFEVFWSLQMLRLS